MPDQDQDQDRENSWKQLVHAAKEAGATDDDSSEEKAPSAFVAGVIAMREGLLNFARTIIWRRWSLVVALLAIALYLTVYFIMKSNPPTQPEPAPAPSLPQPPDPSPES